MGFYTAPYEGVTRLLLIAVSLSTSLLPAVAALHPLNGFGLLGVAVVTTRLAWEERRAETGAAPAAAASLARSDAR